VLYYYYKTIAQTEQSASQSSKRGHKMKLAKKTTKPVAVKAVAQKVSLAKVAKAVEVKKAEVILAPLSMQEIVKRTKIERLNPKYAAAVQNIPNVEGDVLILEKPCGTTKLFLETFAATKDKVELCKRLSKRHRTSNAFGAIVDFKAIALKDNRVEIIGARCMG